MNYSEQSLAGTLKDAACQIFLSTLDKIDGPKDLVLSKTILVQLDSICGMQKLRQNAVDKVFKLQASSVISETMNRVYVIRSSLEEVRLIAEQINSFLARDDDKIGPFDVRFWIIFLPKMAHHCDLAIEEEGIYEYVTVLECPLGLIPLEYDVYSLEDESIFKSLFLHKDTTPLGDIVNSISQLQFLSGNIVDVHGQGRYAKIVADKLDQVNLTTGLASKSWSKLKDLSTSTKANDINCDKLNLKDAEPPPAITDLYIIDRDCDYASVLLSQLNYEGILDESFSICCNKIEFQVSMDDSAEDKTNLKHSMARDSDPIYRDIRDNHFSTVFSLLKTKNSEMKEKYSRSQDKNLSNLKNFVTNELKGLQQEFKCLGLHISACEEIMKERNKYDFGDQLRTEQNIIDGVEIRKCLEYVTKMIEYRLHPHVPLRLLSLLSLFQGGLPPRDYEKYYTLYCKHYGLFNDTTFNNLRRLGLLTEMNISLNTLTGGLLSYGSSSDNNAPKGNHLSHSLSLASFTGAVSSLTEKASGKMASVVSSSIIPRRGNSNIMLKKFQLVPEIGDAGYNIRDPKDPAFVFGGAYIPLICQLIDYTVLTPPKKNPSLNMSPTELMKLLPGPNFKRKQAFLDDLPSSPVHNTLRPNERSILVFFIGGVTFAEITALRFIAKKRNVKIVIAATSIVNGNKLMASVSPEN